MTRLGRSDLDVSTLCLGGNVFGWTTDEAESFAILDAYRAGGGTFIDTADSYSAWVPGNSGGDSEEIIGRWLATRDDRDEIVVATKVGSLPGFTGLSAANIRKAAEGSLRRLGVDSIDLYWAHVDDPDVPIEETLGAFDELVREGKVRQIGASNFTPERLAASLDISERDGLAAYVATQPKYNLVERAAYEGPLADLCAERGVACVPYYGLASGFLTGKYRPGGPEVQSARAAGAGAYLSEPRGRAVLEALDAVAAAHETTVSAVALAWLAAQPTVASPIASARTVEQLADLLPVESLRLTDDELDALTAASA